ncbi:MAG: L-idonate 5-dehydrogenase [Hyphomicrobiaceae bacterium]
MRAVVIHAPHDLRIEEWPLESLAAGQVRIAIEAGGICGSDLHYYHNGGFGTVRIQQPMVLGHEVAGTVDDIGPGVTGLNVGDRVAISPSRPCGRCTYCQTGAHNHCLDMRFYGSAMRMPHIQGAFRETLVADAAQCFIVPPDLDAKSAAMAEPLAVCLHAVRRAGSLVGKRVLVTGAGPIGVLCAMAARRAGAIEIMVTDIEARPLDIARTMVADKVHNVAQDPDALTGYAVDKGTIDVLFEASGNPAALVGAFDALRPKATIVQVGLGGEVTLPINTIVAKEFSLKGTFRFDEEFGHAVEMISRKLIDVAPLVTATYPFSEARDAFDLASDRNRAMKVQLSFA